MTSNFFFIGLLFLSLSSWSQVNINYSTFALKAPPEVQHDHYICLGGTLNKPQNSFDKTIIDLKIKYPSLFKDLSSVTMKNCFSPSAVPDHLHIEFDQMLNHIDQEAGYKVQGNFQIKDDESGLRNEYKSFSRKLWRAELLIGGTELAGMGILIALPKSVTKWPDNWMQSAGQNLKRAWTTAPVMDKDEWAVNYIGHPLAGAMYYNALRSQGATRLQSFLFSTVQSTFWEYTIEAVAEQPSIQDLIVTPVVGSVIGELSHQATLRMKRRGFNTLEKVVVTLINPTYVLNNGYK